MAVLDDDFEFVKWLPEAVERSIAADQPRVTMGKKLLSLNEAAVALLVDVPREGIAKRSAPIAVDLFYDVAHGAVGIGRADPEGAGLVLGKRTENGKTWSVGAAAFLRHFGLTPLAARRFNAFLYKPTVIAFEARVGFPSAIPDEDDIPF